MASASASQSEVEETLVAAPEAGETEAEVADKAKETERDDSISRSVIEEGEEREARADSCTLALRKR